MHFKMTGVSPADPHSNSPLISFRNEMDALRVAWKNLDAQLDQVQFTPSDIQPFLSAASQIVVKLNHLFSIFLRDFYYPLKWSQNHCEKERTELLEHVQFWYREFQQHVDFLSSFPHQPQVQQMLDAVKTSLLYNSMVTNRQPPRIMRREKVFATSVQSLRINENQNQNQNQTANGNVQSSRFRIYMLNEDQTKSLFQSWQLSELNLNVNPTSSPNLISPSVLLNLGESQNILRKKGNPKNQTVESDVQNPEFEKLKVNSKEKGRVDILELKFCLLYTKTVVIDGVVMETWCLSLPFVLMSNLVQACSAQATIFWDNYFKTEGKWLPFQVKEQTNWADLSTALIHFFKFYTQTEWNLTNQNLEYIGKKIFKSANFHGNSKVMRKEFCSAPYGSKEKDKIMTIWKYLFAIVEVIKKHLAPFWNSGAIVGFIDRVEAEDLVRTTDRGTFLIRFSDSLAGGVSYTVAIGPTPMDTSRGYKSVAFSVEPLSDPAVDGTRDLRYMNLDKRITSPQFTDVLCFEPGSNHPVLKPKGEKFTRPAESAGETEASGTASGANGYGKPVVIVWDDPNASQSQSLTKPVTTEPRAESLKAGVLNPEGGDSNDSNLVKSTSATGVLNASQSFGSELQNQNQNWSQNQNHCENPTQYQNYYQNESQYQNQNQNQMDMENRPREYLFSDLWMDVTMEMNTELEELSPYVSAILNY